MGGPIVDATLVAAPKQCNTTTEKEAIKAAKSATAIWPDQPAKTAQKDTDVRWTVKFAKARPLPDGRSAGRGATLRYRALATKQHHDLSPLWVHPIGQGHRR